MRDESTRVAAEVIAGRGPALVTLPGIERAWRPFSPVQFVPGLCKCVPREYLRADRPGGSRCDLLQRCQEADKLAASEMAMGKALTRYLWRYPQSVGPALGGRPANETSERSFTLDRPAEPPGLRLTRSAG